MKFLKKAPCKGCPFRKDSLQGFLGPETVETILPHVHGETGWACHESLLGKPHVNGVVDTRKYGLACTGAVICATKSHKSYRPGLLADLQFQLEKQPAVTQVMDWWEFVRYHTGTPRRKKL